MTRRRFTGGEAAREIFIRRDIGTAALSSLNRPRTPQPTDGANRGGTAVVLTNGEWQDRLGKLDKVLLVGGIDFRGYKLGATADATLDYEPGRWAKAFR